MVDISRTKFIEFLVDPNAMSLDEANAIEKIINQYPYFNVAKAVQSIAFKNHNSTKFNSSLKRCSSSSLDRARLREIIISESYITSENIKEFKEDLDLLTTHNKNSFLSWLKKTKSVNYNSKTNANSLIEKFLQSDQKLNLNRVNEDQNITKNYNISKKEFMTETLAKIYLKQEKYTKAIKAYEILSLKYPEKIILFANQIKKIKRILNNKK
ncbi:MAG: hypothetical protein CMC53_03955 [Flavobacteriaceae bacterium]|nr:hypothetical protein [Flavobacteriaceae bacterium]